MDFMSAAFNGILYSPCRIEPQDEEPKRMIFSDLLGFSCTPQIKQANLEKRCWCLIQNGKMCQALHISNRIENSLSRSQMQVAISFGIGEKGNFNKEFFIANQIPETKYRDDALRKTFFHSVKRKDWELAERVARILPNQKSKIEAFSMLTKVYVYKGEVEKVRLATEYIFHHLKSPSTIWEIKGYFFDRSEFKEVLMLVQALPRECPTTLMLIGLRNTCFEIGETEVSKREHQS